MTHPRLLIVGTTPYSTKDQSRSFDAFFHYWEKENIAQIFCKPQSPVKGIVVLCFKLQTIVCFNVGKENALRRVKCITMMNCRIRANQTKELMRHYLRLVHTSSV